MNFSAKGSKKCLVSWKSTKNHRFGQNLQLFEQTTMFWHFDELFRKKMQKVARFVKKHEHSSIWPKLSTSPRNYYVFAFQSTFQEKVAKSASFREKARKIIDLAKTLQLFEQTTMFWHFDEVVSKKLQKVPHFVKKHEKSSIWRKLATFPTNYHVLTLWWTFQRKVAESASFSEKTLKIIDWAKTCNFFEQSNMFMRFDELFSKRKQKVPRFVKKHEKSSIWPKLATFRTNYHVLAFRWTFQEKNAKSGSFREKARTLIDLAKACNFSKKLPCFGISMIIAGKSCKKVEKVAHFVKNDEKSSIWRKLSTFRANLSWHFYELFRSCKLPCTRNHFGQNYATFSMTTFHFNQKSCKKCLISWNSTKNHRFGQNLQLFEQTTMFWHFENFSAKKCKKWPVSWKSTKNHRKTMQLFRTNYHVFAFRSTFREKVAKSASFRETAKNHWFGQSFATFGTSYHVFFLLMNFQEKSCKKCVVSWKSTKNHRFSQIATFRENYHVLTFRWTLQQKVAKSCSCREKARKIINLAKSLQLFEQTSMFLHFDEFSRKKLPKVLRFVKKHEKSSIWPKLATFRTNYHVLAFRWTFQEKNAKSYVKKCLIDLAKTCISNYHVLNELFSKQKLQKAASKSTKNRRFGENSQLFQQTTMFWRFGELFKNLQKVRLVQKSKCLSMNFSEKENSKNHRLGQNFATFSNYHVFGISMKFSAK